MTKSTCRILALLAAALAVRELASESFTLTTTYPPPAGIYHRMVTTGNAALAREGGRIGVGTTAPKVKLDVNGVFKVGVFGQDPLGAVDGSIYFNGRSKTFMGFMDASWRSMSPSSSGGSLTNIKVFDSAAANGALANTFSVPQGVTKILVEVWGGGGGGGGGFSLGQGGDYGGGTGGGGCYAKQFFTVAPNASYRIWVGKGGVGKNREEGLAEQGGTTNFGDLITATGGQGGYSAGATHGHDGDGGICTSDPERITMDGLSSPGNASNGGTAGTNGWKHGVIPGGGGDRGTYFSGIKGGDGANGRVIVWW